MVIKIEVKSIDVDSDPPIVVYEITLSDEEAAWSETFGSKELAKTFLLGVQAASSFTEVEVNSTGIPSALTG